ncbi:MAG TPA: hypothetical protein VFQ23_14035 [Anaerolineales bacterium]|nr:hypothetical protein [Anaerolineales bacterium]
MSSLLISLSSWLHTIGTIVFIGYYLLLSLIFIPALKNERTSILSEISKRSRLWMYVSLLIFALTGSYLTLVDSNYLGLANFGNFWGILMLVKHLLILGMIGMGFWFNAILRVGPMMRSNSGAEQARQRFRLYVNLMAISGVLVLLLTALAQVE